MRPLPSVKSLQRVVTGALTVMAVMLSAGVSAQVDPNIQQRDEVNKNACIVGATAACAPLPNGRSSGGPWGAIAISESNLSSGFAYGFADSGSAQRTALANCNQRAGRRGDCRLLGSFVNACVALATTEDLKVWSYSGTRGMLAQAEEDALNDCRQRGGKTCSVATRFCTPSGEPAPDLYASIAISEPDMNSSIAWHAGSRTESDWMALDFCRQRGGAHCKIAMWARDACAALATSEDGKWNAFWNVNRARAQAQAIQACNAQKAKNCLIQQSVCAQDR